MTVWFDGRGRPVTLRAPSCSTSADESAARSSSPSGATQRSLSSIRAAPVPLRTTICCWSSWAGMPTGNTLIASGAAARAVVDVAVVVADVAGETSV